MADEFALSQAVPSPTPIIDGLVSLTASRGT